MLLNKNNVGDKDVVSILIPGHFVFLKMMCISNVKCMWYDRLQSVNYIIMWTV